jgi:hypothetical protein
MPQRILQTSDIKPGIENFLENLFIQNPNIDPAKFLSPCSMITPGTKDSHVTRDGDKINAGKFVALYHANEDEFEEELQKKKNRKWRKLRKYIRNITQDSEIGQYRPSYICNDDRPSTGNPYT